MSKSSVFWGKSESEVRKEKRAEKQEQISLDEALSVVVKPEPKPFTGSYDHSSYSVVKTGTKQYQVLECKVDLSSLQSQCVMLDSKYDNEARAQLECSRLVFEQIKKNARENK